MYMCIYIYIYMYINILVGGFNPLKNISHLGSLFPIYGKIKFIFQTTNQYLYIYVYINNYKYIIIYINMGSLDFFPRFIS